MKLAIGIVLFIALIVMGIFTFKAYKENHKLVHTVRRILIIGFFIVLMNMIVLFATSQTICLFAYSMYFAAADWLLYYLFRFSIEYIGNVFEHHVKKKVMWMLLIADDISVILNNVFGHLFSVQSVDLFDGKQYYQLIIKPFFFAHYAIVLMLITFCLISLFYRAFTAPFFYRKKYLVIALVTVALVVLNASTYKMVIDFSIFGYVVEGICIYYCAFVYTPQRLLSKTLYAVAKDMSVALFVMDIEGKKLYSNTYASELLDEEHLLVDKDDNTLEQWCRSQYMDYTEEFTKERTFYRGDEELILKIQLQRMVDSNKQLQGGYFVIQDRTEEINNLKRERYLATHDHLTGAYNKEYFFEKAEKYIRRYADQELLMICTDIKDFKMINDFFGTQFGDTILINFAKMLEEKKAEVATYGRLGNDIFGILIPKANYNEKQFVRQIQDVFTNSVDERVTFPMINYIGVYEVVDRSLPISVMCDRARMAIATIKGDYHKKVAYYDNKLRDNILYEQELISNLDDAIEQGQLKMYLQPQMSSNGTLLGAEALVRWIHPEKGEITPGEFVPVFERNGLISDVDKYVWELACKQLQKWKEEGREHLYISVNISPRDFYFLNIYQSFTELVEKYDIDPQNLKLEITETAIVMDFKRQIELISRLRQTGFIVEMDDFGSGYSSLNMLKDIHVDVLKIDMAFLKKAKDEDRSKKILQMIISLSKQLGMPVITEGVETSEQVEFLTEMGCDMFQGYYFARPMPVEQFEQRYLN